MVETLLPANGSAGEAAGDVDPASRKTVRGLRAQSEVGVTALHSDLQSFFPSGANAFAVLERMVAPWCARRLWQHLKPERHGDNRAVDVDLAPNHVATRLRNRYLESEFGMNRIRRLR